MAQAKSMDAKLASTILYLLRHCTPERPGLTSLLKMLYYADHDHYRKHLCSITGGRYVAMERGPVLDGYKATFAAFEKLGVLKKREVAVPGRTEKKWEYAACMEPDETLFSDSELSVLDAVIKRHGNASGVELSMRTHLEGPWVFAWNPRHPGQPIPYTLFRWLDNTPDDADLALARKRLARASIATLVKTLAA